MRTCSYLLGGLLLAGCGGSSSPSMSAPEEALSSGLSFEQYKASVYQEPDTGIYIVDGDIPVVGEDKLREFYAQNIQAGALLINRSGGADTAWSASQALNLTYCVSTLFSDHAKVVEAMQRAALVWEKEAHVAFIHDGSQDNNCTNTNTNVLFDVRPGPSNAPYAARAFFPNDARASRNLYIKPNQVPALDAHALGRVLAHELGHVLGFRHEHTRVSGTCYEDSNWRAITPYDTTSIMHYDICPGYTGPGLILSNWDAWGVTDTYKRGPVTVAGDFDGNDLDDVLTYRPGSGQAWVGYSNSYGSWTRSTSIMSAGFDFWSPNDRVVVLDFNNDGRDDLFVYRPGGGPAYAMQGNANRTFTTTMAASNFAGFDFGEPQDRAFAFDYDNDGNKDLFFYRPISSVAWVARSNGDGTFSQAYGAIGIGGYFPNSIRDQVRVLDYDGDGRDDLFFFRPGGGWTGLVHNTTTGFVGGTPSSGFLGYDFGDPLDEVLVLDYNGDTRDDLLMYRPGTGAAYLARGTSTGLLLTTATTGIGGYDILERWDTAVKLDFNNDSYDDLFFYRPGMYASYVLQGNGAGGFSVAYGGMGIGGTWAYDVSKHQDKVVVLDHDNDDRDDLYLYRTDNFRQVQSLSSGQFSAFYPDSAIAPY
ncbi:FG-GAP-like repeat-containing protein [Myxococcus qinghaiensis]|uniref:FG-GAP-like repeat-containing protein n=1 Tax=Myxococcus qinghaiensis TaxID=2906758 RepID=UPI0020A73A79|nr:FG-GAP-like repeat-containing protein [Myxococcus qinghaiensis]MCP3168689.1 FG-GAP-like repeat-containing protein [Myxococcus qinghaiensis]